MGARRKGRELAVQALYQIEMRGELSPEALRVFWESCAAGDRAKEFGGSLVRGVCEQRARIDSLIADVVEHWRVERLSPVDCNVLRVATFELLQSPTAPVSVIIDEAIEIARRFGSTDSAVFVNGILDQIAVELGLKEHTAGGGVGEDG
jgi:transcription antitermination protein NusB